MFYSIHESLTPCTLAEVKALPKDVPFVAVLTGSDYEKRTELKARFCALNAAQCFPDDPVVACGMSDFVPGQDTCFQDVFKRADADMYENKKELKNKK